MSRWIWGAHSDRLINHMVWNEAYEMGLRKPRYPVPAITLEIEVDYWFVDIYNPVAKDGITIFRGEPNA